MAQPLWWQKSVFYQVYPRSFADGNGDGIGDLPGLIGRLDYLRDLGVDALWLSPHYPSPLVDCGYDVADYTAIASEYGSLDDFRRFLDGAHQRGLRVVLDLVLNHTSDQHPWFQESRRSRMSARRDWYIWRPGRNGGPPNNWTSTFGGSAWELDPATGEYYYHYFFKAQPDLNWRNPAVRAAMYGVARFWLEMGVDGFRLDAIGTLFENSDLPDHSSPYTRIELLRAQWATSDPDDRERLFDEGGRLVEHQVDLPEVHEVMRELRAVVDEYPERLLVGETEDLAYHGSGDDELHLVFNFPLMHTPRLTPAWVRANQKLRLAALPADSWPCNTLNNHDSSRLYTRYCEAAGEDGPHAARLALALMLTLPGTPFLYNGEEIGMTDLALDDIRQFRDMLGVWTHQMETDVKGLPPDRALAEANAFGRDKCRTPMQWANAANGGFCPPGVTPWLPVNPNFATGICVAEQQPDPTSLFNFYRSLLHVRRAIPALQLGRYEPLENTPDHVLAFMRSTRGGGLAGVEGATPQTCLVAMNFAAEEQTLDARRKTVGRARRRSARERGIRCLFSTARPAGQVPDSGALGLGPFEVFVGELDDD